MIATTGGTVGGVVIATAGGTDPPGVAVPPDPAEFGAPLGGVLGEGVAANKLALKSAMARLAMFLAEPVPGLTDRAVTVPSSIPAIV